MGRVIVITTPELSPGYQMAHVQTIVARSAREAQTRLEPFLADASVYRGDISVIAIHSAYLADMDEAVRRRIDTQPLPAVVALPTGLAQGGEAPRREQLASMLRRAIGFEITFQAENAHEGG